MLQEGGGSLLNNESTIYDRVVESGLVECVFVVRGGVFSEG